VLRVELGYFTTNAPRMNYPAFHSGGLPIGSGAVESAAKHVVQVRMKRSGMRWSDSGGEAMLALCAYLASNRAIPTPDAMPKAA
jgi:monomeric isocitrate dehydrogenase